MNLAVRTDLDTAPEANPWFQPAVLPVPQIGQIGGELHSRVQGALLAWQYGRTSSTHTQENSRGTLVTPHHGRIPALIDRTIKGAFMHTTPTPALSLQPLQEWEGYVTEIRADTFTAQLTELTAERTHEEETADFPTADVPEDDRDLLAVGSIFRWVIGYLRSGRGTKRRVSQITFRRLPAWTAKDLSRAQERATALSREIEWD